MLGLLRRIRRSLIEEGQLGKYLVYATGEIILVVVGILIALSINNWNEGQKETRLSIVLLQELRINLIEDIDDMKSNVGWYKGAMKSAEIILFCFENDLPENDSLNVHYARVALVPQFLPTRSAYQSFQNEGIRILQSDSLRNAILSIYEADYTFLIRYSDSEWQTSMEDYSHLYRDKFSYMEGTLGEMRPVDYAELKNDMAYRNYLNNRIGMSRSLVGLYEGNIRRVNQLISEIDKELSRANDPIADRVEGQ